VLRRKKAHLPIHMHEGRWTPPFHTQLLDSIALEPLAIRSSEGLKQHREHKSPDNTFGGYDMLESVQEK